MKTKRYLAFTLIMIIVMLLSACSGGGATQIPSATPKAEEPQPTEVMEEPTETIVEPTQAPQATDTPKPAPTEALVESMVKLPEITAADYTDAIVAAGSSTVYPLSEAMAVRWEGEGGGSVTIDSIGSGAVSSASARPARPISPTPRVAIKDTEVENCKAIGRTPIEFRVGTDALAVIVSTENDFVTDRHPRRAGLIFSTAETMDRRPPRVAR